MNNEYGDISNIYWHLRRIVLLQINIFAKINNFVVYFGVSANPPIEHPSKAAIGCKCKSYNYVAINIY